MSGYKKEKKKTKNRQMERTLISLEPAGNMILDLILFFFLQKICAILMDSVSGVSAFEFMYCKVQVKLMR